MSLGIQLLIAFAVGGLLGFFFGWLKGRGNPSSSDARLEKELRQQIVQRDEKQRTLQEQLQALNQRSGELGAEVKSLTERLATERQQIETIQERFRNEFKAVSNQLILDNATTMTKIHLDVLEPQDE